MKNLDMEKNMASSPTIEFHQRRHMSRLVLLGVGMAMVAFIISIAALIVATNSSSTADDSKTQQQCDAIPTLNIIDRKTTVTPRNVIFFISDGMGQQYPTVARDVIIHASASSSSGMLNGLMLDSLASGTAKTRSLDTLVTDSAAAATALATGLKTFNGWISDVVGLNKLPRDAAGNILTEGCELPNASPLARCFPKDEELIQVKTVLEGAEEKGLWTGLVSTARITHATPAAFSSHTPDRNLEGIIARQQISQNIEVLLGGGRRFFLPNTTQGSERTDDINVIDEAKGKGYKYVETAADLKSITSVPVLGLFNHSHISYSIDRVGLKGGPPGTRPTEEPTLAEMTSKAIELLSASPNGFFLMVEAGRIDHAGHTNDVGTAVGEVMEYDDAMSVAMRFAQRDGQTLVVGTSDHDTGGLSVGCCNVYAMDAEGILGMRMSAVQMSKEISEGGASIREALERAGVPSSKISESDFDAAASAFQNTEMLEIGQHPDSAVAQDYVKDYRKLGRAISSLFTVGWTSLGHTGGDVNVYSYGPGKEMFTGVLDNSEVGQRLISLLNVNAGLNATVF